jgi:UDPglucose 6-dehydrogenase
MNNHQRERFAKSIIKTLYSTVSGKTIAFFGWAFKKDTNDTRESAAIHVADSLIDEQATIKVYDPKVNATQMLSDLNYLKSRSDNENAKYLKTEIDPYTAMEGVHAIAILTEWDEFKTYDWKRIYKNMQKPAFVFDGRNVLDHQILEKIGFVYKGIGF